MKYVFLFLFVIFLAIVTPLTIWQIRTVQFNSAYEEICLGQNKDKVKRILARHHVPFKEEPATLVTSGTLEASTTVGLLGSHLVLNLVYDDENKIVRKYAFDTGFNMYFF